MLRCSVCGHENRPGARFCDSCGAALSPEPTVREERKIVTILFADLVGFTQRAERMDPEDVRALLQPYWQRLRSELERFGGTVEKFIGDAVMALFGAPVAHEDDPERAVRAALAIRDWVREEQDIQARIAVNTGEALVVLGARPNEGEGMASGDVVNTAARLQSAAPVNGILVGETTWRATRDQIEYIEAPTVAAKGKSEPIRVWEPVNARARVGMDLDQRVQTPLVGRDRELAVLSDAFERVRRDREPQLVTVVGVPGIGKSRVVAELFREVEDATELVWWRQGRALPYGVGVSFWALAEMVKAQAGIHENDDEGEARVKLRESVDQVVDEHERDWVVRHMEPLIGLGEDVSVDRTEAFTGWRRYLEGLAEQRPLVLVFEDLHWADEGLLDFVDHLAEWAGGVPLLVVGTARPELLDRRPDWGGGKLNAATLALTPLGDADAARVIAGVLDRALLPAEMQEALLERAGGNPLYAEQFSRLYLELGSIEELPLPENVQGIIAARLDALPAEEKQLLQDAAVLGKVFWSGGVSSLTGLAPDPLAKVLHALERKGFVRRERRSAVAGESEFAFRHVLVREVAYGQVPRGLRADKHVAAAKWIESLGRAEDHAELLAHHYSTALELARASGRPTPELEERARISLTEAGERAAALNSFTVAADFYSSALDLWPADAPGRALALFAFARSEYLAGEIGGERLREASAQLLADDEPALAAEAEALAAEAAWHRGDGDEVGARLQAALELVEGLPPSRSKAWIVSQAARYAMLAGRSAEAIAHASQALDMATALGLTDVRIHALNNLGSAKARDGDLGGLAELQESAALAAQINSPELARALNNLGSIHYSYGHLHRCHDFEREAVAAAERFGLTAIFNFARANVLSSQYRLGAWDDALRGAETLLAEGIGAATELNALDVRAWIRLARGDLPGAKDDSTAALDIGRRAMDPQSLYPAIVTNLRVQLAYGDEVLARSLAEEVLKRWEDPEVPFAGPGEAVEMLMRLTDHERLLRLMRAWEPATKWRDGALALLSGEFEQAAEVYADIGAAPDEALARCNAARVLVAEGKRAEADRHLRRALDFYRSVGATRYIAEADQLRAASA